MAKTDSGAGAGIVRAARAVVLSVFVPVGVGGGVGGGFVSCEEADAGEEGAEGGETGADDAEGLLDYGPDYGGGDGVFEVGEVDEVEGPDADDGGDAGAVGWENNIHVSLFIFVPFGYGERAMRDEEGLHEEGEEED